MSVFKTYIARCAVRQVGNSVSPLHHYVTTALWRHWGGWLLIRFSELLIGIIHPNIVNSFIGTFVFLLWWACHHVDIFPASMQTPANLCRPLHTVSQRPGKHIRRLASQCTSIFLQNSKLVPPLYHLLIAYLLYCRRYRRV